MNRREPTDKGIINGSNPHRPGRSHGAVLVVDRQGRQAEGGRVRLRLPQHHADRQQWCGDYAGFAQIGIEKAFPGAVAMFWTGCGARRQSATARVRSSCASSTARNSPTPSIGDGEGRDEADHGNVQREVRDDLAHASSRCPPRRNSRPIRSARRSRCSAAPSGCSRNSKQRQDRRRRIPHYPVQVWTLGDQILWVALGGEVVIDYALRLKKELPTRPDALGHRLRERRDGVHPSARV